MTCTCNTNNGINWLDDPANRDPDCPVHGDGANKRRGSMAKAQKFNHEPREWENGGRVQKYCLADGQLWPCDHAKRNLKALTDSEGKPKVATSGN